MEHFYQNIGPENWFNYEDLYHQVVLHFPTGSHFIEVGSWKGRSSAFMAVEIYNSGKNIKFDCVDTWEGSIEHSNDEIIKNKTLFDLFAKNVEPVKHLIHPVRSKSTDAAKLYTDKSLNFVFIDACHEYECVKEDIQSWLPKIAPGGIIAGHDYSWDGVKQAVTETIPSARHISRDCWILEL
jgi:predicted O-methyltransferase YrrM